MPRQLPWKVNATANQGSARPRPGSTPSTNRSPAPPHRSTPAPRARSTPRRSLGLTPVRSPSTSPPPEPLEEEFMIEGIDHDDRYRMVEDEFLAVAGDFTRHLHAAEYQRLKNLAKSQNAETIQNISRPVTGDMTDLAKRRQDVLGKQRSGLAKVLGKRPARDDSPPPQPPTSLQGLMNSPRKKAVPLTTRPGSRGLVGSRDLSRFDAGVKLRSSEMNTQYPSDEAPFVRFKREPSPGSDDDHDDLDGQPRWPSKFHGASRPGKFARPLERQVSAQAAPARSALDVPRRTSSCNPNDADHNDCPTDNVDDGEDFFSRLRARRAEQKRRREVKIQETKVMTSGGQAAALNEIPFI
ncbi:hypothetical protein VTK26DRAFT_6719 [Humicola hyalothermophila]